jgi:hypothetical protein
MVLGSPFAISITIFSVPKNSHNVYPSFVSFSFFPVPDILWRITSYPFFSPTTAGYYCIWGCESVRLSCSQFSEGIQAQLLARDLLSWLSRYKVLFKVKNCEIKDGGTLCHECFNQSVNHAIKSDQWDYVMTTKIILYFFNNKIICNIKFMHDVRHNVRILTYNRRWIYPINLIISVVQKKREMVWMIPRKMYLVRKGLSYRVWFWSAFRANGGGRDGSPDPAGVWAGLV